jgi:hypothetical protein
VSPFEAIQYVGTPIALVAFVAALIAWSYRARLAERRKSIESAPEAERAKLLDSALRDFSTVPTDTLTREQRYNLANKLIDERAHKFKLLMIVSVIIALLFTAMIGLFTIFGNESEGTDLVVRVHGVGSDAEFITTGQLTLDAGADRDTRPIGPDGQVRFTNVRTAAFKDGVTLIPDIPGYRAASPVKLTERPAGNVYDLAVEPMPTRVYGTVIDTARNPVTAVILTFKGGAAADTTGDDGTFSVTLPHPPGERVTLRALKNGAVGFSDMITIPEDAPLTIFFTVQP